MQNQQQQWIDVIRDSLASNTFVKASLGNYKGTDPTLKNIYIKKLLIKREEKLSFTYRYQTKDIVKNYSIAEGIENISEYIGSSGFRVATLFTTAHDLYHEYINEDKILLRKKPATITTLPALDHDKQKNRLIAANDKPYLTALKITDEAGTVYKAAQDKYRQINHYIEILSTLLQDLPKKEITNIVDMGAGKGYLTFALYDYLTTILKIQASVTGVEYRQDLVDLCNGIAHQSAFERLHFVQGIIGDYDSSSANVLIALHACDTATDDAIAGGIHASADLIVVAPCCHKQIRREMEKSTAHTDLDYITRHGIYLERQAEMVTDSIRALVLEYYGYTTKVFEFITDVHTPKNIMITAQKNHKAVIRDPKILAKIKTAKDYFGIGEHYLERLMDLQG